MKDLTLKAFNFGLKVLIDFRALWLCLIAVTDMVYFYRFAPALGQEDSVAGIIFATSLPFIVTTIVLTVAPAVFYLFSFLFYLAEKPDLLTENVRNKILAFR